MTADERTLATFAATGVTVDRHIADLQQSAFERAGCLPLARLQQTRIGASVRVGGLLADGVRRPPTANGTGFLRLENGEGLVDVIVPAELLARRETRRALRSAFIIIDGTLRAKGAAISILADVLQAL